MTWCPTCPQCGHRWKPSRAKGRPKTAYYTADGVTLHAEEWAFRLDTTVTTLRKWARRYPDDFGRVVKLFTKDAAC